MNQEKASIAIEAAIAESEKLGVKTIISIVDAGGNLVAFERMDGAWLASINISIKKAKTAILFDMPCRDLGKKERKTLDKAVLQTLHQPGGPLFGIDWNQPHLTNIWGHDVLKLCGAQVRDCKDVMIGGIGVAGSTIEIDSKVADAATKALV